MAIKLKVPSYLYRHQKDLIKTVLEEKEGRWYVVKAFRQSAGKTFSLENLIIFVAVTRPGSVSIMIEPTNSQCSKVAEETAKAATGLDVRFNGSSNILRFPNGSMILFKSGEADTATVRGYTAKKGGVVVVDEAGFIKDEYFNVLFPVVQKHKAVLVLASTPDNQSGTFYNLYMRGIQKDPKIVAMNWSVYLNDMFTTEELNFYKSVYSSRRYTTEVLGEFPENDGQVFKNIDKAVRELEHGDEVYLVSIDWGSGQGKDYTAVVWWNREGEAIQVDFYNELSPVEQIEKLASQIRESKPWKVVVEQNSIGAVYLDMLRREVSGVSKVEGFVTDNKSKNRIIDNLAAGFEHGKVRVPRNDELMYELRSYEEQVTKSGLRTYNGANGVHDDLVMALAIGYDQFKSRSSYSGFRVH